MSRMSFLFLLFLCMFSNLVSASVTNDDVEKYISEKGLESAIAQLFVVGIPTDYKNSSTSSDFNDVLTKINVGGVMINGYNLPYRSLSKDDREVAFAKASSLISMINSTDSNRESYPVLIYSDFESYSFSSIKYPLVPPPSPLVLASTADTKFSYYAGKISGYQLRQLGVDIVLGPVLDPDSSRQGVLNKSISMRSFSDTKKIIIPHAMAFVKGLNDSQISSFVKHYPTYGSVYSNAHKESPVFTGSVNKLIDDFYSFKILENDVAGIMTSHLIVQQSNKSMPVTYNKKFINEFIKSKFESDNVLLITDDLSNMASSKRYIKDRFDGFDYSLSAVSAFKAGHDLLLFSHLSGKTSHKHSDFNIEALRKSIKKIEQLVLLDEKMRVQLVSSLRKIFELKLKHPPRVSPYKFDYNALSIFEDDSGFKNADDFFYKTFDSAVTKISSGEGNNLLNLTSDALVLFVGTKEVLSYYDKYLKDDLSRADYEIKFSYRSAKELDKEKKKIIKAISASDYIFFSAESLDHVTLLDYIRLRSPKLLDKIVVFVHASPHIIKPGLLNSLLIYGNYSRNPISYSTDIKIILGELVAKDILYSPLPIANGSIHSTDDTIEPQRNKFNSLETRIFNTSYERKLYDELVEAKKELKDSLIENDRLVDTVYSIDGEIKVADRIDLFVEAGNSARFALVLLSLFFLGTILFLVHFVRRNNAECYWSSIKLIFSEACESKFLAVISVKKIVIIVVIIYFIFPNSAGVEVVKDSLLEINPEFKPLDGLMKGVYKGDFDLTNQ